MTESKPITARSFIKLSGSNESVTISGNVAIGRPLLDAQTAIIQDLAIHTNQIYADDGEHITLGELFNARIADNLFSIHMPAQFAKDLKDAASTPEKRKSFLAKMAMTLKPTELQAAEQIIERLRELFFS